jgi:endonuclease-3
VTRAEKARRIEAILEELYPGQRPFLRHGDPFTLLVAVVLSAQCTDKRVNEVTPRLFARARTPAELVKLRVRDIERIIRPCGLAPTKARNLSALARRLVAEHDCVVPESLEALEALPGVGHKTAAVVRMQAFERDEFPVDTHIHRLAARWGLSRGTSVVQTERDLRGVFPRERWGALHLQIIHFGREHCPAIGHDWTICPICSWAASKARMRREQQRRRRAPHRSRKAE